MERALGRGLGAPFRIATPFRRIAKDRVVGWDATCRST